jgi:hypothetical protein
MSTSKEKLISIYEEAKRKRIVLNQEEFAKAVGYSRVHLFKKMNEVPQEVIEKAESLLKTNNVSDETIYVKDKDLHEFAGSRVELIAAMRAAIKILTLRNIENEVKLSELESKLSGGKNTILSFAEVSLKLERMMQDESERILDEWRKK